MLQCPGNITLHPLYNINNIIKNVGLHNYVVMIISGIYNCKVECVYAHEIAVHVHGKY
jgi:hypothetical protein